MSKPHEALSGAYPPPPPPDVSSLQIKVQPDDALFGAGAHKNSGKASRGPSLLGRLLLTLVLCGLAWAGGAYFASGHMPFDLLKWSRAAQAQQNAERDEMLGTLRQMTEDIRALKASVDDKQAAPAPTTTGATVTDVAARIDKLEAELTSKLAQVNDRLAALQQQLSTSHTAVASRAPAHPKHEHLHDAFNPALDPNAPGAPQPLGSH